MSDAVNTVVDPSATGAWARLEELASVMMHRDTRSLIKERGSDLVLRACGLTVDLTRQRLDDAVVDALISLAQETQVADFMADMDNGARVNVTEGRAVLHTALRKDKDCFLDGTNVSHDVHRVLHEMKKFADGVRSGSITGAEGSKFTDVVNIGIGGSDLGPAMATGALEAFADPTIRCHYVSNLDPADLQGVLTHLDPATTLFIVVSKTFTTAETMANAQQARGWISAHLGDDAVQHHFAAVSTNLPQVGEFGIDLARTFGFWDWVGGRYSLTSAVGLSTMIAIGPENFDSLLHGFRDMDAHAQVASARINAPLLLGLVAVWNRNFLKIPTNVILPYSQRLRRFPAYLQQLSMESNGKSVRRDGSSVTYSTGAIVWGEPGTNGQHSFYQLLHQGTDYVSADIVVVLRQPDLDRNQQQSLVAHALAQASVLSMGRTQEEWRADGTPVELLAHKCMEGNRPTTLISMEELTPYSLGALISLYENSVIVQGAIWGINSFDQWGVELGKKVATAIEQSLRSSQPPAFDEATNASVQLFRSQGI